MGLGDEDDEENRWATHARPNSSRWRKLSKWFVGASGRPWPGSRSRPPLLCRAVIECKYCPSTSPVTGLSWARMVFKTELAAARARVPPQEAQAKKIAYSAWSSMCASKRRCS